MTQAERNIERLVLRRASAYWNNYSLRPADLLAWADLRTWEEETPAAEAGTITARINTELGPFMVRIAADKDRRDAA